MRSTGVDHGASASTGQPRTSLRLDWVLTVLSVWLIGGFYVDLWAHSHGRVDDTFFTLWHALLYTGAAAFGVVLGAAAIFGTPRQVSVREALPGPYRLSFVGAIVFVGGGVLDLAWHTLFGFEVDVEALLSPTHLLLAAGGLLMVGGPLRSASARMADMPAGTRRSWRLAGPFVIPLAMGAAALTAFSQYANPIVDPWSSALGTGIRRARRPDLRDGRGRPPPDPPGDRGRRYPRGAVLTGRRLRRLLGHR